MEPEHTPEQISVILQDLITTEEGLEKVAQLLARILPRYVQGPHAAKYFRLWEECGFHLTPVHFYQPIPDTRTLTDDLWAKNSELVGVEMNEPVQLDLLRNVFPRFQAEYNELPL